LAAPVAPGSGQARTGTKKKDREIRGLVVLRWPAQRL
jgi:hypothetical protein